MTTKNISQCSQCKKTIDLNEYDITNEDYNATFTKYLHHRKCVNGHVFCGTCINSNMKHAYPTEEPGCSENIWRILYKDNLLYQNNINDIVICPICTQKLPQKIYIVEGNDSDEYHPSTLSEIFKKSKSGMILYYMHSEQTSTRYGYIVLFPQLSYKILYSYWTNDHPIIGLKMRDDRIEIYKLKKKFREEWSSQVKNMNYTKVSRIFDHDIYRQHFDDNINMNDWDIISYVDSEKSLIDMLERIRMFKRYD